MTDRQLADVHVQGCFVNVRLEWYWTSIVSSLTTYKTFVVLLRLRHSYCRTADYRIFWNCMEILEQQNEVHGACPSCSGEDSADYRAYHIIFDRTTSQSVLNFAYNI